MADKSHKYPTRSQGAASPVSLPPVKRKPTLPDHEATVSGQRDSMSSPDPPPSDTGTDTEEFTETTSPPPPRAAATGTFRFNMDNNKRDDNKLTNNQFHSLADDDDEPPAEESKVDAAGIVLTSPAETIVDTSERRSDDHSTTSTGLTSDSAILARLVEQVANISNILDDKFDRFRTTDLAVINAKTDSILHLTQQNKINISATTGKVDKLKTFVDSTVADIQLDLKKIKDFHNPQALQTTIASQLPSVLSSNSDVIHSAVEASLPNHSATFTSMASDAIQSRIQSDIAPIVSASVQSFKQSCEDIVSEIVNNADDDGFMHQVRSYLSSIAPAALDGATLREIQSELVRLRNDGVSSLTTAVEGVDMRTNTMLNDRFEQMYERILRQLELKIPAAILQHSADAKSESDVHSTSSTPLPSYSDHHDHATSHEDSNPGLFQLTFPSAATVRLKSLTDKRKYYMEKRFPKDLERFLTSLNMFNSVEVMNKIGSIMALIRDNWSIPGRVGPIRKYMLSTDSFDPLPDLAPSSVLAFYDDLQKKSAFYLIGVTPFDAINLDFPVYGLSIPGLGDDKYHLMSAALFDILQKHLPSTNADIANQISIVNNIGCDGYMLLWNILKMTIPAFANQKSQLEPDWYEHKDIAKYATACTTFHRIERFRGRCLTDKEKTYKFLGGIKEIAYSGVLTTLRLQIQSHVPGPTDDYDSLPLELQIGSLAVTIKDLMDGMVIDTDLDLTRRINRTVHRIVRQTASVHSAIAPIPADSDSDDDVSDTPFDIPGIDPVVRAARDNRRPLRGKSSDSKPSDTFRRPRRVFDKDSICGACKMVGHVDADCFHLARAVFLATYMKNPRNAEKCRKIAEKIEAVWSKQHSTRTDGRAINSAAVLHAYCDQHDLSVDQVAHLMGPDRDALWMDPITAPTTEL